MTLTLMAEAETFIPLRFTINPSSRFGQGASIHELYAQTKRSNTG